MNPSIRPLKKLIAPAVKSVLGKLARNSPIKTPRFGYPNRILEAAPWLNGTRRQVAPGYVKSVFLPPELDEQRRALPLKARLEDATLWAEHTNWRPKQQFTVEIADARICRSLSIVSPTNEILWDLSPLWNVDLNKHPCLLYPCFFKRTRLKGRYLFLSIDSSRNYFHWMLDLLPKILVLEEAGYSLDEFDGILVDVIHEAYQKETFRAMGVPMEKIIETSQIDMLEVSSLVVPSMADYSSFYHHKSLSMLADRLRKSCLPGGSKVISRSRRIFVDRSPQWGRCLRNRAEILEVFAKYGIEVLNLDGKSISKQIELFSSAEWVIGIHGASLTNLLFCRSGTKVLELFHPQWALYMYWGVAAALGQEYYYLLSDGVEAEVAKSEKQKRLADIAVSPDVLDDLFRRWES